jgi:hypothetical protein
MTLFICVSTNFEMINLGGLLKSFFSGYVFWVDWEKIFCLFFSFLFSWLTDMNGHIIIFCVCIDLDSVLGSDDN